MLSYTIFIVLEFRTYSSVCGLFHMVVRNGLKFAFLASRYPVVPASWLSFLSWFFTFLLNVFMWNSISGFWASLMAQMVKNLPAVQEARVQPLGQEDPLEKGMAAHCSVLAWRIPWTEELGGLQSIGSQRVRHRTERLTCKRISGLSFLSVSLCVVMPILQVMLVAQLCSFLKLFWLLEVLCISLSILWLVFQFLYKALIRFSLGLNWIYRSVWGE